MSPPRAPGPTSRPRPADFQALHRPCRPQAAQRRAERLFACAGTLDLNGTATPARTPWTVSFKASKTSLKKNTTVKFRGTVAPAASLAWGGAKVNIQRKGKYYLRASMPANSKQLVGNSAQIKVVVK